MRASEEETEAEGFVGAGTEVLSDDSGLGVVVKTDDGILVVLANLGVGRNDEVEGSTEGVVGRSEDGPTLWVEPPEEVSTKDVEGKFEDGPTLWVEPPEEGWTKGVEGKFEDGPALWVEAAVVAIEAVLGSRLGVVVVLPPTHDLAGGALTTN